MRIRAPAASLHKHDQLEVAFVADEFARCVTEKTFAAAFPSVTAILHPTERSFRE